MNIFFEIIREDAAAFEVILEYNCSFTERKTNKFMCYNCKLYGHKHDLLDNKHILKSKGFWNKIKNDLVSIQDRN